MVNKRLPILTVAIIGAGAAGLKALREAGLDPLAFEQSPEVSGAWIRLMEPFVAAQYWLEGPGKSDRAEAILIGRWLR